MITILVAATREVFLLINNFMLEVLKNLFAYGGFIPQGYCYLWKSELMMLHIVSDFLIAIAYYSIPVTLVYFFRKRVDLPLNRIILLFSALIIACGTSHVMEIWTLWYPIYWLSGFVKAVTAAISLYTAVELVSLVPKLLALPSPAQLEEANRKLEREISNAEAGDTLRKQVQAALQESQRWLSTLTEFNPNILYVYDLIEQRRVYVNRELFVILGYTPEEGQQMGTAFVQNTVHPDDLARMLEHFKRFENVKDGEILELEHRMRHKNGEWRWLVSRDTVFIRNAEGKPKQILGTATDITERKVAEEKLRKSEANLATAQRVAHVGSWEFDIVTQELSWSDELCRILGLDPIEPELAYPQLVELIYPDDRAVFEQVVGYGLASGSSYKVELRILPPNSHIRYIEARGEAIFNELGQVKTLFGTVLDITQRKQAEEVLRQSEARFREKAQELELAVLELKRTQAQLIQSEKMSSLGQMVGGIAHEINNPVSFIYGNIDPAMRYAQDLLHLIELYRRHYPQPIAEIAEQMENIDPNFIADDFPKLLGSMQQGADRINQIVLSLQNFSRLDQTGLKRVDIHEGIDNTLLLMQHRLKQQSRRCEIQVIKDYGQLPRVECYPDELNQVFMNLIGNAIDALEESLVSGQPSVGSETITDCTPGTADKIPMIRIRTEVIEDKPPKDCPSSGESRYASRIAVCIADNGLGMTPEVQQQIFNPFFTTKPPGKGTGLGLSISYRIVVDGHGGQFLCHSGTGWGTEFVIEMPIAQVKTPLQDCLIPTYVPL
jgi:PAS domain S-box-containing protein